MRRCVIDRCTMKSAWWAGNVKNVIDKGGKYPCRLLIIPAMRW